MSNTAAAPANTVFAQVAKMAGMDYPTEAPKFAVGDAVTVKVTHTTPAEYDEEGEITVPATKTSEIVTAEVTATFPEFSSGYSVRRTGRTIVEVVTEAGKVRLYRADRLRKV